MKKILFTLLVLPFISCTGLTNPNYEKNLATAKKIFVLHGEENLEAQHALLSDDMTMEPAAYGMGTLNKEAFGDLIKGYHVAFDEISFEANVWLPGTDNEGNLDGSVRTYGTWTGVNVASGKKLNLKSYHFFNFNEAGLIQQQGDFFDATGMMNATGDKKLVVAELKIKAGKQDAVFALMANESYGLKATRNYKGCNSLVSTFNEESNTLLVISDWDSYEEYAAYLTWRTEEDTELVDLMKPLLIGGMKGLRTVYPNSMYTVY